jgi:type I restriction enzyme S subunit
MSSVVPDGWSKNTINECCEILDSQRVPVNSEERAKRKGDYPYYGANGVQGYIDDYIFEGDAILLAEDGGNFDQYANRPIAQWVTGKYWVNNHAHILRAKDNATDKWIFYSLVHKNILKNISGGTRAKLNQSDLKEIEILLSPLPEQKKIASILTSVDEVIENTQKQIDKLQDLKKATMNELLTKGIGHTEFKDSELGRIPKSWEVLTFSESNIKVLDGDRGNEYPKEADFKSSGFCLFLSAKNVTKNGFRFDTTAFITKDKDERLRKGRLNPQDIVITTRGTVGNIAFYDDSVNFNTVRINSGMAIVRNNNAHIECAFIYKLLSSGVITTQLKNLTFGSAQPQLTIGTLNELRLPIPPLAEQSQIVSAITSIQIALDKMENKLSQTKSLKKSLMQDLLTGKVRVTVN